MPYDRDEASLTPPAQTHYDAPRCQNTSMGQQCDLEAGHDGVHWHRDGANINVWYTDPEQWERMVKLPTPKWRPDDSGYIVEISQSPEISRVMWFWEVGTPRGERNPKTGLYPPRWWRSGCAFTRWGAKRQAMRAIKRRETPDNWETFTVGGAS